MGLFSKLFDSTKEGSDALDALKKAGRDLISETEKKAPEINSAFSELKKKGFGLADLVGGATSGTPGAPAGAAGPARETGSSYGQSTGYYDEPPAEENQYNFDGNYIAYFEKIFSEEFPNYTVTHAPDPNNTRSPFNGGATVFTFSQGGNTALIVELKSEKSESQRLRRSCEASGTPYLRFYYDHDGWWNARSYVVGRVRGVLR
ncbi:MAG: hypothetical protein K6C36_07865 [Clostridia bacterium]|nr:hypothetical protein [Clostridia bacterium]